MTFLKSIIIGTAVVAGAALAVVGAPVVGAVTAGATAILWTGMTIGVTMSNHKFIHGSDPRVSSEDKPAMTKVWNTVTASSTNAGMYILWVGFMTEMATGLAMTVAVAPPLVIPVAVGLGIIVTIAHIYPVWFPPKTVT